MSLQGLFLASAIKILEGFALGLTLLSLHVKTEKNDLKVHLLLVATKTDLTSVMDMILPDSLTPVLTLDPKTHKKTQ